MQKLALPTGQEIIVAEGGADAQNLGSFSVRLYQPSTASEDTTLFTSGLIHPFDGMMEQAFLTDVDGDGHQEVVVITRSAGSGGYLSAYAVACEDDQLFFRAAVEGVQPDMDPLAALRKSKNLKNISVQTKVLH